jgi:hypothetical protein
LRGGSLFNVHSIALLAVNARVAAAAFDAPGGAVANYLNRARPADEASNRRWRAAVIY